MVKNFQWTHLFQYFQVKWWVELSIIAQLNSPFTLLYLHFFFCIFHRDPFYVRKVFDGLWAASPLSPLYHHIPLKLGQHHQKTCQWQTKWRVHQSTISFTFYSPIPFIFQWETYMLCGGPSSWIGAVQPHCQPCTGRSLHQVLSL